MAGDAAWVARVALVSCNAFDNFPPRLTAGITASISPHTLRHFLFTWLKTQGIDDALIQPYSGHATRQSLEIYSRLALADVQQRYDDAIGDFPV
jgi:integrase/recombinase XerD